MYVLFCSCRTRARIYLPQQNDHNPTINKMRGTLFPSSEGVTTPHRIRPAICATSKLNHGHCVSSSIASVIFIPTSVPPVPDGGGHLVRTFVVLLPRNVEMLKSIFPIKIDSSTLLAPPTVHTGDADFVSVPGPMNLEELKILKKRRFHNAIRIRS